MMFETVLAHAGGWDELAMFVVAPAAFIAGGYFLVYRPMKADNAEAADHEDSDAV